MDWWKRQKAALVIGGSHWSLPDAVDQAQRDWQNAKQLVDLSEESEVEDAIYYLQLTEKRYMYLLGKMRRQYAGTKA
ncbi:DUF2508 family protein [Brevibacillus sp. SYP-B805]|jgi:hypothetical protein|uniref:DUF2508 family protein n=1 Tax=Brevibacillus sp. SYP-B805 TaxID=1578199 RepID=UPI0013EB5153|nr:DUF2508 family protein [Brevibacillus sp. SYP-B805]NGQ96512.1 DUF2508 family protein [Brevibacillus sp. SYP-B805]